MASDGERFRFRSFAERYIIERAKFFTDGQEEEQAWKAMLAASAIYKRLRAFSVSYDDPEMEEVAQATPNPAPSMQAIQQAVKSGKMSPAAALQAYAAIRNTQKASP